MTRAIIGDYEEGRLSPGFYPRVERPLTHNELQELKGQFTEEYRAAGFTLIEQELLDAATPEQDLIQAVHALAQIDAARNGLGKFVVEWYELHHPQKRADADVVALTEQTPEGLNTLVSSYRELGEKRAALSATLETQATTLMPNTSALIGGFLAAKLLDHAGSIARLSKLPSATIQLLGAEQALFRFLKMPDGRPPKHGVLISHPLVQGVPQKKRGAMARRLANAIAIAVRVDAHKGEFIAPMLQKKLEDQYHALTRL